MAEKICIYYIKKSCKQSGCNFHKAGSCRLSGIIEREPDGLFTDRSQPHEVKGSGSYFPTGIERLP